MAKNKIVKDKKEFLPSEWARMKGLPEVLYLWHDTNLGIVNEEEFDNIGMK